MARTYRILGLGASYGSLLGVKLVAAGHSVTLACLSAEVDLINREGARVRMPVDATGGFVTIDSRGLPGSLTAAEPRAIDPSGFDLVTLAMQEPQYRSAGVRELLAAIASARVPCVSIMNMPPPPYLARLGGVPVDTCRDCYADASVWDGFDPALMTLCSPDAQAFRPPGEPINVLQVRLPTNFKAARFPSDAHTGILRDLAAGIEAARFDNGTGERVELPVKLRVHESSFVPLAKWSMLLAGNYRCIRESDVVPIRDAVHGDVAAARAVYDWVGGVCRRLGAAEGDLVPFEKYAAAARSLVTPSSAARAVDNGAVAIERVDRLVQRVAAHFGMQSDEVDRIVARVDVRLEQNRQRH